MNDLRSTKLTVSAILAFLGASIINPSESAVGQEKTVKTYRGSTVLVTTYTEVPEATEQCSQEERQWWDSLRKVANEFQKKMDRKSEAKLAALFAEGLEKGYRVPPKDRRPQVLRTGKVVFPDLLVARARAKGLKGTIELSIEYRADGSIGEVKILKGLDKEMDSYAVQAARQNIFLPAIKDGAFVTDWASGGLKFSTQR